LREEGVHLNSCRVKKIKKGRSFPYPGTGKKHINDTWGGEEGGGRAFVQGQRKESVKEGAGGESPWGEFIGSQPLP